MDIKTYISSGIIEAYVMGLATDEEVGVLECIQKHNAEVRAAVLEAQNTLEVFANEQAIAPPPALKSAIWAKIADEKSEPVKPKEPETVALYATQNIGKNTRSLKWLALAASVLLLLSIALNLYQDNAQKATRAQLATLVANQKSTNLAYQNLKSKWDMANNPAVKAVPLLGVEKHPDMKAMVYFEQGAKSVYLALENLPIAPKHQQYQLWAIVDGKPVSLGMYNQEAEIALQKMTDVATAQAFAVTLEKRGGSPTPTLDNMYVMGKI